MKIFITGAGGFLGTFFTAHLQALGHLVAGSECSAGLVEALPETLATRQQVVLGEVPPKGVFADQDVVLHCAYAPGRDQEQLNIDGTILLAEAARAAGVKRQVFFSSYSARPDATSGYGRMKYALEQFFVTAKQIVLRPGLVVGPGGLCQRMGGLISRYPLLPLPGGGRNTVPLIGLEDLAYCLMASLDEVGKGPFNLAYSHEPTLKELLVEIRRALGRACFFVPFPIGVVLLPVRLLQLCGINLGVDPDSLRGYRVNQSGLYPSDLNHFSRPDPDLGKLVDLAFGGEDKA